MSAAEPVTIAGKRLQFSNLDKPLYPDGFNKGQVIEYYLRMAPVILPHLRGRAITLKRYPNGSTAPFFFEKNCPAHRPSWIKTARIISSRSEEGVNHCVLGDRASLLWVANLAALELHVPMARAAKPDRPTAMVFDLDPGPPANLLNCIKIAFQLRDTLKHLGLESFAKTSGGKGLHMYVPLNTPVTFDDTKSFANAIASLFAKQDPDHVVSNMTRSLRPGKVFIDWSQNDMHKTTVCVYSLRAREHPSVSMPVTWPELSTAARTKNTRALFYSPDQAIARTQRTGDLFEPVLSLRQRLPMFKL
jgi:bifunctional non-homologous end joining protein LigD